MAPRTNKTPPKATTTNTPIKRTTRARAKQKISPSTARQLRMMARSHRKEQAERRAERQQEEELFDAVSSSSSSDEPEKCSNAAAPEATLEFTTNNDDKTATPGKQNQTDKSPSSKEAPSSPTVCTASNPMLLLEDARTAQARAIKAAVASTTAALELQFQTKVAQQDQELRDQRAAQDRLQRALDAAHETAAAMSAYYFRLAQHGPTSMSEADYERAHQEALRWQQQEEEQDGASPKQPQDHAPNRVFGAAAWLKDLQAFHDCCQQEQDDDQLPTNKKNSQPQLWLHGFYSACVASARLFSRLATAVETAPPTYADHALTHSPAAQRRQALLEFPVFVPWDQPQPQLLEEELDVAAMEED